MLTKAAKLLYPYANKSSKCLLKVNYDSAALYLIVLTSSNVRFRHRPFQSDAL
jgi:hypothetical protein